MPEKPEVPPKPGRVAAKPRKKDSGESAAEREAALVLAAAQFKALGDPTRLRIINFLSSVPAIEGGADGADVDAGRTVGDVSAGVFGKMKVSSTLSHHLKELRNSGLIVMKRRGKNQICRVQADAVEALRCYLPSAVEVPAGRKAKSPQSESGESAPTRKRQANASVPAMPAARTRVRKKVIRPKKYTEGGDPSDSSSSDRADNAPTV